MTRKQTIIVGLVILTAIAASAAYYVFGKKESNEEYCDFLRTAANKAVDTRKEGLGKNRLIILIKDALSEHPRIYQESAVGVIDTVYGLSEGSYEYYPDKLYRGCMEE